jgi:hypothetical protein
MTPPSPFPQNKNRPPVPRVAGCATGCAPLLKRPSCRTSFHVSTSGWLYVPFLRYYGNKLSEPHASSSSLPGSHSYGHVFGYRTSENASSTHSGEQGQEEGPELRAAPTPRIPCGPSEGEHYLPRSTVPGPAPPRWGHRRTAVCSRSTGGSREPCCSRPA